MTEQKEPYEGKGQISLIIKTQYLDQIKSGTKKQEFREIRHNTASKYCHLDKDGEFQAMKTPDTLELLGGYRNDRPRLVVRVTGVTLDIFTEEKDGQTVNCTYIHDGKEYLQCRVIYDLGEVVS